MYHLTMRRVVHNARPVVMGSTGKQTCEDSMFGHSPAFVQEILRLTSVWDDGIYGCRFPPDGPARPHG
jgi:hypothetical protein